MRKSILIPATLVMAFTFAGVVRTAQAADAKAGEATYAAKCKTCHGATGVANPAIAKMLKVEMKPLGGAEAQALTDSKLAADIKTGYLKMKPVAGLTDAQIADVIAYMRTLKK